MPEVVVAPLADLPPGSMKIVVAGPLEIGVYNCGGEFLALEDRCSHDDGPLALGVWDDEDCVVICPRHGASFDLASGRALTLPAANSTTSCAASCWADSPSWRGRRATGTRG